MENEPKALHIKGNRDLQLYINVKTSNRQCIHCNYNICYLSLLVLLTCVLFSLLVDSLSYLLFPTCIKTLQFVGFYKLMPFVEIMF